MTRSPAPDVAIVGGGIVGTAAAALLAAEGANVPCFICVGIPRRLMAAEAVPPLMTRSLKIPAL